MPTYEIRSCKKHGEAQHRLDSGTHWRCNPCQAERVADHRRKIKRLLVDEAGGKCIRCGYDKCIAALEFHHRNPDEKSFGVSRKGITYALDRVREEAAKCDPVCANCHRELEAQS